MTTGNSPAPPRRAATVLLLRQSPEPGREPGQEPGPSAEVLLVRRSKTASFMANSYVFPGGRVEDADYQAGPELASRVAAVRELQEEVGISLADPAALPLFSHWITPSSEPKRFDTDFFLAEAPPGQEPRADASEVFDLLWLTPLEALRRYADNTLKLPPPTMSNLEDLQGEIERLLPERPAPEELIPRLLEACARRRPTPVLPKLVPDPESGGIAIVMPWDAAYPGLPGEGLPLPSADPRPLKTSSYVLLPEGRWWARSG